MVSSPHMVVVLAFSVSVPEQAQLRTGTEQYARACQNMAIIILHVGLATEQCAYASNVWSPGDSTSHECGDLADSTAVHVWRGWSLDEATAEHRESTARTLRQVSAAVCTLDTERDALRPAEIAVRMLKSNGSSVQVEALGILEGRQLWRDPGL